MAQVGRETPVITNGKIVKCRLRQLMGEKSNMRIQELSDLTNLRRNTITALYYDRATRIDTVTIAAICVALNCTPGDLLVLEEGEGTETETGELYEKTQSGIEVR